MGYYSSPRWTQEILDCSMPMTFDTYSKCSYNCLYCFSYFQKSHTLGNKEDKSNFKDYQCSNKISWVNLDKIKRLFLLDDNISKDNKQFFNYIADKKVMQWGGLADQFDEYERKYNITLDLLKFFKTIDYPLCFSTKSTWWLEDERYTNLFKNQNNWNCKFSIINLDKNIANNIEIGVDSPKKRIEAIKKYVDLNAGGATLRLRPFILGMSDLNEEYIDLIKLAVEAGAKAISTEFLCLEGRADARLKNKYKKIQNILGYDIYKFYKKNSVTMGYFRLKRSIKYPYMKKMKDLCDSLNIRFYVSDAHFKELCHNGSCCGLQKNWNYYRGQFTNALLIAKKKGKVHFSDIKDDVERYMSFNGAPTGYNTITAKNRAVHKKQQMKQYIREIWNNPNKFKSPYRYFSGVLIPIALDKNKDVVYEYKEYNGK